MKQITARQYAKIHPYLLVQRRNVRISNIVFINAVLYVLENGCKWRALPERSGNWSAVYARFRRGVLERLFAALREQEAVGEDAGCFCLDSTSAEVHPDGTGARKTNGSQNIGKLHGGWYTKIHMVFASGRHAIRAYVDFFLHTKGKIGGSITLRTASQIATEMTTGLFAPLYSQIDPLHLGEAARAMSIASQYGKRLLSEGQNIEESALDFILSEYPSHGFVIDRNEASMLFRNVRKPKESEKILEDMLGDQARWPENNGTVERLPYKFLSTERPVAKSEDGQKHSEEDDEDNNAKLGNVEGPGFGDANEAAREQPKEGNEESDAITELNAVREVRKKRRNSM